MCAGYNDRSACALIRNSLGIFLRTACCLKNTKDALACRRSSARTHRRSGGTEIVDLCKPISYTLGESRLAPTKLSLSTTHNPVHYVGTATTDLGWGSPSTPNDVHNFMTIHNVQCRVCSLPWFRCHLDMKINTPLADRRRLPIS